MKRYFTRYMDGGRRHPFLLVSAKELKATARLVFGARERFLVKALRGVEADAEPRPQFPTAIFGDAQALATGNAGYLAALYAAAGDERKSAEYARRAKRALLAFAEAGLPAHVRGYGFLPQMHLVSLAIACDLSWEIAGWTDAERGAMRRFFYSQIPELVEHMHSRHMSNHAAWPMARIATTAALFGDQRLMKEVLDGPDSYCHRLAHEFFDDGMSYEQSASVYQEFSVLPVIVTALAARGAGARPDPVHLAVANDMSLAFKGGMTGDYTMPYYPADEREFPRPRTKDLHQALTAQFQLLRPDTTCPAIGDYGEPTKPMSESWIPEVAWDLYGDRRAARLVGMGGRSAEGARLFAPYLLTLAFGRALPKEATFASKSVIYPQAGYAVLKSAEGDGYWGSDGIEAVLKFGPYGNGHGHADKLHLDISGAGRKCCIEELERESVSWRYWNSTVSHNTVVVGGKSQPGDEGMFALNNSCGRLVGREFGRGIKVATAEANDVYSGMKIYRRTVGVTDSYVVDIFEVEARRRTVFDWFLHGKARVAVRGVKLAKGTLGFKSRGYQFLKGVKKGRAEGAITAMFSDGHRVFVATTGGFEVFSAVGP